MSMFRIGGFLREDAHLKAKPGNKRVLRLSVQRKQEASAHSGGSISTMLGWVGSFAAGERIEKPRAGRTVIRATAADYPLFLLSDQY
jgi:hypothetical protein